MDIAQVALGLGNAFANQQPILDLRGATVGNIGLDSSGPPDSAGFQTINVSQYAIFTGTVAPRFESGGSLTIHLAKNSLMVNQGTLQAGGPPPESMNITGDQGSVLLNQGLIEFSGTSGTIGPSVIGTGTVEINSASPSTINSQVEFGGFVGPEQTLLFSGQAATPAVDLLMLDKPPEFLATIAGFAGGDTIELANATVTSDTFANGVLTLRDGHDLVANLHFAGSYSTAQFVLGESGGSTFISLASPAPDPVASMLHGWHAG